MTDQFESRAPNTKVCDANLPRAGTLEIFKDLIFEHVEIGNGCLQECAKLSFVAGAVEKIVLVQRRLGLEIVEDHVVEFGFDLGQQVRTGPARSVPFAG